MVINNIQATTEEFQVYQYLKQLKDKNIIKSIEFQPKPFELTEKVKKHFYRYKQLKTKTKFEKLKRDYLINSHIYTTDFKVIWNENAYNIFMENVYKDELNADIPFYANIEGDVKTGKESYVSYIEVKPIYEKFNMTRMFLTHIQPQIWEKHNIYVQMIKPLELFKRTIKPGISSDALILLVFLITGIIFNLF